MTTTQTRDCPTCGTTFTWTSRNPRRRFCTPRCKAAWWRTIHYHRDPGPEPNNNVTNDVNPARLVANDDQRATLARCPHCQTPITVLTLLVPPAAAHVATPQAQHG